MQRRGDPWPSQFPYQQWYLDAIAGESAWNYVKVEDKEQLLLGILPFQEKTRFGLKTITPPPLCPRLGPFLFPPRELKTPKQLQDFSWRVLTELALQLPTFAYARICWPYHLSYGRPWQVLGWEQRVRYSYVLPLSKGRKEIWNNFKPSLRNKIRKAEKSLTVIDSEDWLTVHELTKMSFIHRGVKEQITNILLESLDQAARQKRERKIWLAKDKEGRVHAGIWLIWDQATAYNLLLGSDPALRQSGAAPLLLWHAIRWAREAGLEYFDFEGSHLPGVESFFRSFGATAWPYYEFEKGNKWTMAIKRLAMG